MKKLSILFLSILMFSTMVLAACGGNSNSTGASEKGSDSASGEGGKRTIKVSIGVNDKHPEYEASLKFKELVEAESDDLTVEVYHSGQIADDRSAIEMLQFGTLDVTIPSTSPLVNFIPAYGVFDLPFTVPNEEVADKVLDGPFGDKMLEMVDQQGLVGLAWWENGFRNLTNDVKPVAGMEDVKGLKIRTMENEIHLDAWKALGANPTPMAFTELFTAMQQGTIDGQENPYPTILLSKYPEVQKHISNTNHVYTPFIFLFSKKIWEELSAEQQDIISKAAVEAGKFNRERTREVADESLETLKKEMTFTEIEEGEFEKFQEAVKPVIDKYKDKIGAEIVDEFLAEVDKAK
ncbi:TRAP transporter substrate-binding protein [Cytobacillus firmus]|uniref:TRAP transporter substrate-binding protein n=1 Tax=Cytobacillus firmus TaxID=1399 RepID=A0AA46PNY1_CYTFI|nr:TRAP transporter substrate-binding protein [Cytobacillus firmus]MBY6052187.1 TRAP transporter substrate-binding protein [Cytobacillus firmus]MCS0654711.1 TRAP transporter substrate-binding protein [Cytobacillus firmus]UYG93897.1 TRAP transporter substrate-binding protein [Cytobacillus firmus]WHY61413.1 TRAP transporter substrate-binding protein [Cytobacillus firmus]